MLGDGWLDGDINPESLVVESPTVIAEMDYC